MAWSQNAMMSAGLEADALRRAREDGSENSRRGEHRER